VVFSPLEPVGTSLFRAATAEGSRALRQQSRSIIKSMTVMLLLTVLTPPTSHTTELRMLITQARALQLQPRAAAAVVPCTVAC